MLIRQTLAYLPAQLLGPLTQFATAIVLTHYLGAAQYGLTMLIFASQELVFLVCMSWWTFYMLRYSGGLADAAARERYGSTERHVLFFTTLLQAFATAAIVLIAQPEASAAFYLSACAFVMTRSYLNFLTEYARKNAAITAYSLAQIIPPLGGLALTVVVLTLMGSKPETVLLVFAAMQLAVGLLVGRNLGVSAASGTIDRDILRSAMQFGLPIMLAGGFGWVAAHGIRFIVQAGEGAVALGLLTVGWTLATRLSNVTAMIVTAAAYPLAVRAMEAGDADGARRQLSSNSALLLGVVAPATLGVIAINEPLVRLLIAPEYHAATIAILPWALVGAALRNLRIHGWDQMYLLFEAPKAMLALDFLEGVITLAGTAIGLSTGGILGAVIGATLATVLVSLGDLAYLRRRFAMPVPIGLLARVLVASAAMYGLIRVLPHLGLAIVPTWSSMVLVVLIGMAAYGAAIMLLFPEFVRLARAEIMARRTELRS
jgi:O-antigen/teichoic acid export membrane protein